MGMYRLGDIVRICGNNLYSELRQTDWRPLIFKITDIDGHRIKLDWHSDFIPITDVEPVPINGVDDVVIYYDPVIMGTIILNNDPIPTHRKDYTYYMDAFKNCKYNDVSFVDMIAPYDFMYVHELQHFFNDEHFKDVAEGLKVNRRINV